MKTKQQTSPKKFWVMVSGQSEPQSFFDDYQLASEHVQKENLNATILERLPNGKFIFAGSSLSTNTPFEMETDY